jgi:peptidoglycan hydrolase-like protein with peptidoglycan-binding domain
MSVRNLSVGMVGPDVKAIQEALNVWGAAPPLKTDGKFGPRTDAAVRKFQKARGLRDDGIVGRYTRGALFPVGVATTTIFAMRLRMPAFPSFHGSAAPPLVGPLTLNPIINNLTYPLFKPTRFPRLIPSLSAPQLPDWNLTIPPLSAGSSPQLFGFVYDHVELQPGAQSTFPLNGARQDAFVLTMQNVYRRGPDDGAHQELDLGVQIGTAVTDPNGPWTFNPFVQLTDVDRLAALGGAFHLWQPYAQAGFQFMGLGNPQPALTANLFPVNLGLDVGNLLTLSFAGGVALTMDLQSGRVQAGGQLSAGLTLKLGQPNSPL